MQLKKFPSPGELSQDNWSCDVHDTAQLFIFGHGTIQEWDKLVGITNVTGKNVGFLKWMQNKVLQYF